ncbi:unnamed protein product [Mytilus coruscus]|uniref:Uncharacterized protein n=1 Tax=Mytilus coruscus TaxID=42192 RepID=A0A6J8EJ17_MYTCO|nr:unnamed protein product [Mytilus coruscus]
MPVKNDSPILAYTTEPNQEGSSGSTYSSISGRRSNGGTNNRTLELCIRITAGGAAIFGTIVVVLLVVIFIKRRKLIKVSFTSLTARRDQNNYNEIPPQMSDSVTGQYYEVSTLSEISAPGCQPTAQQNRDQVQHIDTSGYLIPSSMLQTSGDYHTITD